MPPPPQSSLQSSQKSRGFPFGEGGRRASPWKTGLHGSTNKHIYTHIQPPEALTSSVDDLIGKGGVENDFEGPRHSGLSSSPSPRPTCRHTCPGNTVLSFEVTCTSLIRVKRKPAITTHFKTASHRKDRERERQLNSKGRETRSTTEQTFESKTLR